MLSCHCCSPRWLIFHSRTRNNTVASPIFQKNINGRAVRLMVISGEHCSKSKESGNKFCFTDTRQERSDSTEKPTAVPKVVITLPKDTSDNSFQKYTEANEEGLEDNRRQKKFAVRWGES